MISQGYIQGSSVTLVLKFYEIDSPAAVIPASVTLSALVRDKIAKITNSNVFTSPEPGTYQTTLDTTNYLAGHYVWRFLAMDSSGNKFYGEDSFVLLPYTGPSGI